MTPEISRKSRSGRISQGSGRMSRRRLCFESLERRGMLAGFVGALPQMDGATDWLDVPSAPVAFQADSADAVVCFPEAGFVPVSLESPSFFVSDHVPYDWDDRWFAVDTRRRYKSFLDENPGWLAEHRVGESDLQVETPSRNLPWVTFGTPSLAGAFDAWFERSFPNAREYAAFLEKHPTWVAEHGENDLVPFVATDSWYVPWMSFGEPAQARAFDAWFELTYPDVKEFRSFLQENPSWLVDDPSRIEVCLAVTSRYLPWMTVGGPSHARAFDAWVEQAHPEHAARRGELPVDGGFTDADWGASPIWGRVLLPLPQGHETPPAPVPGNEAGPELGADPELEAGPDLDAGTELDADPEPEADDEDWPLDDESAAVQRGPAADSGRSRSDTAMVASWLTVSGIDADGMKLPGGKKRSR